MRIKVREWVWISCFICMSIFFVSPVFADNNTTQDIQTADTQDYNHGVLSLSPGWNFIGTPRRLADGSNKAVIFSAINSAGRSIWTYDPTNAGWKDLKKDDPILPLEGYWVYSQKQD